MNIGIIFLTTYEGDVKNLTASSEQAQALQGCRSETRSGRSHSGKFQSLTGINNGILMEVAPSSKFFIQEFQQAPWDVAHNNLAEMKSAPSQSKKTRYPEYGDIVNGVKKIKPSLSMELTTPLGTADIRGTGFKASAVRNSKGTPKSFTVGVASGEVGICSAGGGETVSVPAGLSSSVSMSSSQGVQLGTSAQAPATPSTFITKPQVPVPSPTPNSTPTLIPAPQTTPPEIRKPR